MKQLKYFVLENGKCPFLIWLNELDKITRARIDSRLTRLACGNYGEYKQLDGNISELKLKFGSGYRIYYTEKNNTIIILLCAGDKKTQSKDIKKAKEYYCLLKGNEDDK
ncbi:TPA: type II toxin-antitoxin system RelE/ParE family toxin [Candidatus Galligastranaerophilus intestinigallinarum]|nr:type II toxin-antitoxin system RelE/ParE family toxin [Candidatus Galligastranaerophilus intestinigallinarum]